MRQKSMGYAVNKHTMPPVEVVEQLWKGSVDMHVHPAPDPAAPRRGTPLEIALAARQAGMRGAVLKSFTYTTTVLQQLLKAVVPEVDMFGSICIGASVGGLSAAPVEEQAKMGCKVVWMPAFDSYYFRKGLGIEGGYRLLDDNGRLLPEVGEILEVVKEYGMVLCSGHIPFEEALPLFQEARRQGIEKMIATHPLCKIPTQMTLEQATQLADLGAYVEHVFGQFAHRLGAMSPEVYVEAVKKIGAERTILSSDYGQNSDPMPAEGFRMGIASMLYYGCTEDEVELMVKCNPYRLLGLEEAAGAEPKGELS